LHLSSNLCNNTKQHLQIFTRNINGSPNVAGVAALIRSYYPKLTASQVKHILMDSGVAITTDVVVGGNPDTFFLDIISQVKW
jgi:subtilisin family serine protease